jgi:hypothetical protein
MSEGQEDNPFVESNPALMAKAKEWYALFERTVYHCTPKQKAELDRLHREIMDLKAP